MSQEIIYTQDDGSVIVEKFSGYRSTGHEIYGSDEDFFNRCTADDLPATIRYQAPKPDSKSVFGVLLGMRLAIHNRRLWITHKDFE